MQDEKHYYQGKETKALLHIEMITDHQMNFKIQGDTVIVCKMICNAMLNRQDIAAAMIAAVMDWADRQGIPRDQLGNMIKFHK